MGVCPMPGAGTSPIMASSTRRRSGHDRDRVPSEAAERADVIVRELRESDLTLADAILRSAFDTFTGVTSLFGDKDYVRTRWLADPGAAFAAERDGQLAGTNFVTRWGTVGFFGPLSVRPELWDQGSRQPPDGGHRRAVRPLGHGSRRPVHLRPQRQAPRALPEVRVLAPVPDPGDDQGADRPTTVAPGHPLHRASACRAGPSPRRVPGTDRHRVRGAGPRARRSAPWRARVSARSCSWTTRRGWRAWPCATWAPAPRPAAGGATSSSDWPGRDPGQSVRFGALLDACEALAVDHGADHVELGVNAGRHEAYAAVMARGLPGGTGRGEHAPGQRRGLQPPRHLAHRRLALIPDHKTRAETNASRQELTCTCCARSTRRSVGRHRRS